MSGEKLFFHIDIDAFYASVEQLDNPQYKNKPVIVGGLSARGVVSTCSYEARRYGVHSAIPMLQAKKLCPGGIFIQCRMKRYKEKSEEIMNILKNLTPGFHQISIDEAFLNMSGMEKLLGTAENAAKNIKEQILSETGLTVSIGGGSNKYIAKIASDISKPDGLYIVPSGHESEFMKTLPLKKVWGIGGKTIEKLNKAGLYSVKDIYTLSEKDIQNILGKSGGDFLFNVIRGNSDDIFTARLKNKSISTEETFELDVQNIEKLNEVLFKQASEIMFRLIDANIKAKTVTVKIRYSDFTTVTVSETDKIINDAKDLYNRAKKLLAKKYEKDKKIRLLGINVTNIENENTQPCLFTNKKNLKEEKIEKTVLNLNKQNNGIICRARFLKAK